MTAQDGMDTSAAGAMDTEEMNHACRTNSRSRHGRLNKADQTVA
jgi:hypothetical protein